MTSYRPPENPRREKSFPELSTARLGLYVFLGSLSTFFLAGILGLIVTRLQSSQWRTAGMPPLPVGLVGSTLVLVAQSVLFRRTEAALSQNRQAGFQAALRGTLGLGAAFLVAQASNWRSLINAAFGVEEKSLYLYSFYLLTGLHAAHVVGGMVALGWVYHRALRLDYSSSRAEGIALCRIYWDYLLVVWILMAAALWSCSVL